MTEQSTAHRGSIKLPFIIGVIVFSFSFLYGGIYQDILNEGLSFSIQNVLFPLFVSFMRGFMAFFITWIVIDIAKRIQKKNNNFSIEGWQWIFYVLGWIFGFANPFFWLILYLIHLAKDSGAPFINKHFHKRVYIWGITVSALIILIGILAVIFIPILMPAKK